MTITAHIPLARCVIVGCLLIGGCADVERNNPFDAGSSAPGEQADGSLDAQAMLALALPLPKALATVVDSLVARLDIPNAPTVTKNLSYDTPLGPAMLTIGALSPGNDITLTIEGYDLDGRLILTGTQTGITIATNDTTRVSIDLRLAIDFEDLDSGDTTGADDTNSTDTGTGDALDTGDTTGDNGSADSGDTTGGDTSTGDSGDTTGDDGTGSTDTGTGDALDTGDTTGDAGSAATGDTTAG